MPTIRQYCYKSVKSFLLILVLLIAVILLCVVVDWVLPIKIHNGLILLGFSFIHEIGIFIGLMIFLFFGYKAFKTIKTEKAPKQEFIKMMPAIFMWLMIGLVVTNSIADSNDGIDCEKFDYSAKLNGGAKDFNGQKYTVRICGSGVNDNRLFGDGLDKVELVILNGQSELLLKRRYKISWGGVPGHEPLTIGKDSITYQDDEKQQDFIITMPPTLTDRARAVVPFFH